MEEEASLQSRKINEEEARACSNAEMEGSSPPEVTGGYSEAASATAGAGGYSASFGGGARYKLMSPAKLPIARSPCSLTIPPGLSPTSFLESPVMLSNIKAEPSPTTGTFSLPLLMQGSGETSGFPWMGNRNSNNTVNSSSSSNFEFQFHPGPSAASAPKLTGVMVSSSFNQHRQVLDSIRSSCIKPVVLMANKESSFSAPAPSHAEPNGLSQKSHPITNNRPSNSDHKDLTPSAVSDRSSEDGYNWRKYGQKLVKGSEFPRSYYKCTYPNCEVKKIFERAPDGQITEIVYKGSHDHPKPQPSRRFTPGTLVSIQEERFDKDLAPTGQEDKLSINSPQLGAAEPNSTPVPSPQQENEDGADGTMQLQCVNEDGEEEDPYAKRRKLDGTLEITPVVKPIREPRVVVQTVSEVDILDDGYRWRKYGQKVVRGNPNPRSYYKCTHAGCPVRKHVERASHDPKAVITTYEGKHNHDVPTARTSSHEMAGPTNTSSGMSMARMRPEDNNDHHPISLDLGVGRSYSSDFRAENQAIQLQMLNSEHSYSHAQGTAATRMAVQACYNGNINMYGSSRENMPNGNGFENAALQAQNQHQHPQNIGRIVLGP